MTHSPTFALQLTAALFAVKLAERKIANAQAACECDPLNPFAMHRLHLAQEAMKAAEADWARLEAIVVTSAALADELERRTG